jgi:hypothetical protein
MRERDRAVAWSGLVVADPPTVIRPAGVPGQKVGGTRDLKRPADPPVELARKPLAGGGAGS